MKWYDSTLSKEAARYYHNAILTYNISSLMKKMYYKHLKYFSYLISPTHYSGLHVSQKDLRSYNYYICIIFQNANAHFFKIRLYIYPSSAAAVGS